MNLGKLYGVGVGPGDPELMTLKAAKIIKECDIIAIPTENKEKCAAYKIAESVIENLDEKEILTINMPMTKDEEILKKRHNEGAEKITAELNKGRNVAFLTLGDPSIYSTYIYIHKLVLEKGYDCSIISGVPSFCAAAARLNTGLVEKSEELHIIPASYQIDDALHNMPGTKIFMKSGKKINEVSEKIKKYHHNAVMVENCGMENEKIYNDISEVKENASYYSLIIAKK